MNLADIFTVYTASNSEATVRLYGLLADRGPAGALAVNLLRACKKSERAKGYRGRQHRVSSYDGKQWAMDEICATLVKHPRLVHAWGWGVDEKQEYHRHVLYVDLPQGQVSFHAHARGVGPDYSGTWDGRVGMSGQRACSFAASLLREPEGSNG